MSNTFKARWGRLPKRLQVTYLLIILVVAIGVSTFLTMWGIGAIKPMAAPNQASLSISSADQNYDVGTVFSLAIYLGADSQDQIRKVQLNSFRYDPTMVAVDSSGGTLKANPSILTNLQTTVNSVALSESGQQTGRLDLTMESMGQNYYVGGSTRLATINFRVLRSGQAAFSFDPATEAGNGTTVLNSNGVNILFSATSGTIALGTASPLATPTPGTTINPTPTKTPTQSRPSSSKVATTSSPTANPEVTGSPSPTPQDSGVALNDSVKVEGSFSKATILLYASIAAGITIIALLIWFLRNKKRRSEGKPKEDDDELI